MATTSIWAVKGWLGKLVVYVENPEKTENPAFFEKSGMAEQQVQGLSDVIDYAIQTKKTVEQAHDESLEVKRQFVSGVNCRVSIAREEMMATKEKFGKTDGVVAYHGYQSFSPGEVAPEAAHEIGVKLAERLWGGKYQVLVATHLDKQNHLHNHFVLNNVSMVDGVKYYRSEKDYWQMRDESDKLCREYGLSVIEEPQRGKSKHYGEWKAEQDGKPTYRGMVKADIDLAVLESMTERQLWDNLYKKGYRIQFGKDITLRPPGKERGLKLFRNFGEDYSIEGIRKRILANTRPKRTSDNGQVTVDSYKKRNSRAELSTVNSQLSTGLRALYFSYLYKMGVLPKKGQRQPNRAHFLFREDVRYIRSISMETRLLVRCGIDTAEQLTKYKNGVSDERATLLSDRKRLWNKIRTVSNEDDKAAVKSEIAALSAKISELRKEVKLCEGIEKRSAGMGEKIRTVNEASKNQGKEEKRHESVRGRR